MTKIIPADLWRKPRFEFAERGPIDIKQVSIDHEQNLIMVMVIEYHEIGAQDFSEHIPDITWTRYSFEFVKDGEIHPKQTYCTTFTFSGQHFHLVYWS